MLNEEYVQESKIKLIPYIYDFTKFETPSDATVADIKKENPCNLLLLLCGRFVPLKRNIIALYALKKLVELKYDVKLLVLDEGPELEQSKKFVVENGLENYVNFLGYRTNVVDYIAACDVLVHPSYTEASNNIVKEAGINSKCVIVCENVGDFSDYIIHEKNGFLANKENPTDDIIKYIKIIYQNKNTIFVGDELKKTILERFQKSDKSVNSHLELLIN
jgi:glycosyltransferase involved in cell wall biosynthesis